MKPIFTTIFFSAFAMLSYGKNPTKTTGNNPSSETIAATQRKQSPLSFIENKGQVTNQERNQRHDIQFRLAAASGLNIFIGSGAIHYQFSKRDNVVTDAQNNMTLFSHRKIPHSPITSGSASYTMYRMDVQLLGANKNAKIIAEEKQDYHENHSTANTATPVTAYTYNRITYKNIYPHIDWVLYIKNGKLEHEFVVNEGGNATDIQLKYAGTNEIKLNADGSLTAITPQGSVTEQPPTSYQQDGKMVKSNFELDGNILTYKTGNYSGALVIDPTLIWATYYGGNSDDAAYSTTMDSAGNVYITGNTSSVSSIATSGAYQMSLSTSSSFLSSMTNAFAAKFNSAGVIQWATYFGGNENENDGNGIATDGSGNVYVTGTTSSTTGIATPGAYQDTLGTAIFGAYLTKFNDAGVIQWGTYYGGSGDNQGKGVATDGSGNVYLTGLTSSASGIATAGAYQETYGGGGFDAFIAKFNGAGAIQWATYFGGSDDDNAYNITTDNVGSVYITGMTTSTSDIATTGAYQASYGGGIDAFLAKFSSAGAIQWATYYGGSGADYGSGVAQDGAGNVYITGYTSSTSGIATPGAYQTTFGGGFDDVLLAKFNSAGAIQWATYYGDTGTDQGYGVVTDGGSVYFTGPTTSTSGMATPSAYQDTFGGGYSDAVIAKFSSGGMLQWATYYGGDLEDFGESITTNGSGYIYVAGGTLSASGIATPGAYQDTYGGEGPLGLGDAFLAKFNLAGTTVVNNISVKDIALYPNPAQDNITITGADLINNIVISNMLGQALFSGSYNKNKIVVSLAQLPTGMYIVRINDTQVYKIVKQ